MDKFFCHADNLNFLRMCEKDVFGIFNEKGCTVIDLWEFNFVF